MRSSGPEAIRCVERHGRLWPLPDQRAHAVTSLAAATALALVPPAAPGADIRFVRL